VASESTTQSEELGGGVRVTILKALVRDWGSHGDHAGGGA